jgi:lysylphosphatidylglycerol synthetase-like protein (DUF2156 family)
MERGEFGVDGFTGLQLFYLYGGVSMRKEWIWWFAAILFLATAVVGFYTRIDDRFLVVVWLAMAVVFGVLGYREYSSRK